MHRSSGEPVILRFLQPSGQHLRRRWSWGAGLLLLLLALFAAAQEAEQPDAAATAGASQAGEAAAPKDSEGPEPKPAPAKPIPPRPPKRFYDREPFDLITLDEANKSLVLTVLPLPLPDRKLPETAKQVGKLKVRLFDNREEEYEVMWRNIAKIELFEALVLREAEKIVTQATQLGQSGDHEQSQKKFDEAYDYLRWLVNFHPNLEGLEKGQQDFLYLNSGSLFVVGLKYEADAAAAEDEAQATRWKGLAYQKFAQSFAILEELYSRNPQYAVSAVNTVAAALERVGDRLISWYARQGDFVATRQLIERLQQKYQDKVPLARTWRERLITAAAARRDAAADHLAAGRFDEALEASREMLRFWPPIDGGRDLVLEIARQYPLITVGVSSPALAFDPSSLENFAARRVGQLLYPTLIEYRERGSEGGRYASPFGTVQQSDDRTELIFDLRTGSEQLAFTGYDLSSNLLAVADPASPRYEASWARLMASVQVDEVMGVRVKLRRPHVLPQSMLRVPFRLGEGMAARYVAEPLTETEVRFRPTGELATGDGARPVIVERFFDKPRAAIEALRKGRIDMIDRLLPFDALRMRQEPDLRVGTYSFPSLFVLAPNTANPHLANRTFRRAVVYAINREVILNKGLLDGQRVAGSRVISAPLPAGIDPSDPSAYAYDERIAPYPYDPVMAAILVGVTAQQLGSIADQRQEPAPELGELVLAHPFGELPRFIARQIQLQLEIVELACTLRELPPGQSRVSDGPWDLLLMEIRMLEPLVDLPRLLGEGGVVPSDDPYVNLALRQLDESQNWKEARDHLYELHRQLHNDLTLIPLWQMTEFFAYHSGMQGVREQPVCFYENVDSWRVIPPEQKD